MAIDHDRLFKELIQTFFKEFMQLFFPQVYEVVDFEQMTFLSEELFTDVIVGERRRLDVLAKGKLMGEDVVVIVHVEPQAYYQKDFAERMFIYSSRLFEKYRCCILPIAVFSYDAKKEEPNTFTWGLPFFEVQRYQFYTIELRKKNWRDFIRSDNPIAAALLSKMGYTKEEKVQVKKEFLRMLVRLELDSARMHLITGFFDMYLTLNDKENQVLREELQMLEAKEGEKIMELQTQWEKDGEKRGRKIGREEGKIEGKVEEARKFINKFIQAQFGDESKEMLAMVALLTNLDILERLADRLFRYSGLDEAKRLVTEAFEAQKTLI
jgi:hypothetical protein